MLVSHVTNAGVGHSRQRLTVVSDLFQVANFDSLTRAAIPGPQAGERQRDGHGGQQYYTRLATHWQ
jgi:hypothetical protein